MEKLPVTYNSKEIPIWVKYWFSKKLSRKVSEILTGQSKYILENTLYKRFKKFEDEGDTKQNQYEGINLMPMANEETKSLNGITVISNGKGKYKINGTASANTQIYFDLTNSFTTPNETLYAHLRNNVIAPLSITIGNTETASSPTCSSVNRIMTSNLLSNLLINRIGFIIPTGETVDIEVEPSVELTNEITEYEPFVGGIASPNEQYEQPIQNVVGTIVNKVSNRNLYDKENPNILYTAIDANGLGNNVPSTYRTVFKECFPNTDYVISKEFDSTKNRFAIGYTKETPDYNKPVYGTLFVNNKDAETIHTGADAKYLVAYVWISGGSTTAEEMLNSIQIEPGTTATPYVEHKEQTLQFTLEQGQRLYKDSKLKDDGIHHKRTQIVLDGSEDENWIRSSSLELFYTSDIQDLAKQNGNLKCNYFIQVSPNSTLENGQVKYNSTTNCLLQFKNTDITTVTQWREWLATHNLVVEYELAEEQIVPYNSTQASQYNAIKNLKTYKGKTIVEATSDELAPILTIQYWEKNTNETNLNLTKVYENKEEIPNKIEIEETETKNIENEPEIEEKTIIDFLEEIGDNEEKEVEENEKNN